MPIERPARLVFPSSDADTVRDVIREALRVRDKQAFPGRAPAVLMSYEDVAVETRPSDDEDRLYARWAQRARRHG